MKELKPGLTIGIPAYNEEAGLSTCLKYCLDQNAVILISDNGSIDQTGKICKDFAERHPSTRVFSHPVNRGSLWNFGHLLEHCETEYFMWLGAHDCLNGDFGKLAVKTLQDQPQACFCAPRYRYFSPEGQPAGEEMDWEPVITDPRPWHRFKRFLQIVNRCTLIHGVFRTLLLREAWKATCSDLGRTPGPDLLIMAWILLRGAGTFQPTLEYRRVVGQNPDAGDYQKKIYVTGAKKNLSPKDTGKRLIHIAENCRNLTWVQKKATVYLVAQKWGRPRGNHPVQLAIYLFSEGKKKIGPQGRRLNNRLFGISGKPGTSHIQAPSVLSRKDVIEKFSRPNLPVAFGKIGTTELLALEYHYRRVKTPWGWNRPAKRLYFDSGVFPPSLQEMNQFASIYREAISQIDGLYLWQPPGFLADFERELVQSINPKAERIRGQEVSFSLILELPPCRWVVVSSFAETMLSQLKKLSLIHPRSTVAREVIESCQFVQAPHFPWHKPSSRASWCEELNRLKDEILSKEFDVAIVGAGAYSLPLLAAVKSSGRKGIHLGGEIQLLFGIKGRRWDGKNLYNDHWVRPSPDETPSNFMKKENGCYW